MSPQDAYLQLMKDVLTGTIYDDGQWAVLGTGKTVFRRALVSFLAKRSLMLVSKRASDLERRKKGEDWPMLGFTMVGNDRLDNIRHCLESVINNKIPGDFVECGVWRGGASIFAKAVLNIYRDKRCVWLADSFEGMPKLKLDADQVDKDLSTNRYLAVSLEEVENNFRKFGLLDDKVKFLKGWFQDTLHKAPIKSISVLRLDGDHYSSTMDALTRLYVRVSDGGYIIIDDYDSFIGCKNAVSEFRSARGISEQMCPIDGHAIYWRKIAS
jgi:O-methyltransferase